jgi:hypothetical protein
MTVAIITARENSDTHYDRWREWYLNYIREGGNSKNVNLEMMSTFTVLTHPAHCHVEYQLRALQNQTRRPDEVLVVSRIPFTYETSWGGWVSWAEPILSAREVRENPLSGLLCHADLEDVPGRRQRSVPMGCSDKNTALLLCRTEYLLVLDDCCLPGPGLVEAAYRACSEGKVFLPAHRQLYLPTADRPYIEIADANTDLVCGHLVMGIWAAPVIYFLDINGWNTDLDGKRGGLDQELKIRMDRYLEMRDGDYAISSRARVYEIGHEYPWGNEPSGEWMEKVPSGYLAPGPSLKKLRQEIFSTWADPQEEVQYDTVGAALEEFVIRIADEIREDRGDES